MTLVSCASPVPAARHAELARPEVRVERTTDPEAEAVVLPELVEVGAVEWPERFLGWPMAELVGSETLDPLFHDNGHRAYALILVPTGDDEGWVVDRGIVTRPDYSQALYERWSRVERRDDQLAILFQVARSELADDAPRSLQREASYDACVVHHAHCERECAGDPQCVFRCAEPTAECLGSEHHLRLGDATVVLGHQPSVRIEWGGDVREMNDIGQINVSDHPTRPVPFFARVRRAQLDAQRAVIVIAYGHGCDEDAFCSFQRVLVQREGDIVELEGRAFNTATEIEVRGDSTLRWTSGELRNCQPNSRERAAHDAARDMGEADYWWHERRTIRHRARITRAAEVEMLRVRPERWGACTASFAAACPYVDIITESGARRAGEVLRHIRDAPATQGLALGFVDGESLVVRLSEEKRETTFVDAVHLELDGTRIHPLDCEGLHCAPDGRYHVLHRGDALTLEFELAHGGHARLVATGYYIVDR